MQHDTALLVEMLQYRRPEGSGTQTFFCRRYLEPWMKRDKHGNYIKIIPHANGSLPEVVFTAHHDTVHTKEGAQRVGVHKGVAYVLGNSNCLGADCTTGVWLILGMIKEKVPGIYVIHSGEEIGCKGSKALVKDPPYWLDSVKAVISFDRYGSTDIITHQMGWRTASDEFALSLADALGIDSMKPSSHGVYTDSESYADLVSECTNISVGYDKQHTNKESQDLDFAEYLMGRLIEADWSKLVFVRDPNVVEDLYQYGYKNDWHKGGNYFDDDYYGHSESTTIAPVVRGINNLSQLEYLLKNYPKAIANILDEWGVDAHSLEEELNQVFEEVSVDNSRHRIFN
jgi:hypothetical protein